MKLNKAKFCYNCDEIFTEDTCPSCGRDDNWIWLSNWITTLTTNSSKEKEV